MSVDERLFSWVNGLGGHVDFLDRIVSGFANDYFMIIIMCLVLVGMWFWARRPEERERNQIAVMKAMASLGIASGLLSWVTNLIFVEGGKYEGTWLNVIFTRVRPFEQLGSSVVHHFYFPHDPSFPSNLAAVVFAVALAVWFTNRKIGTGLILMATLACLARVYVGIHWPSDILGGIGFSLVGVGITYFLMWVLAPIKRLLQWLLRELYVAS
ncbi:MAG: phosphatase PAP2 family protein [Dehalococcoidia bacterium]|nr:phosphatase PAP2 family protein [Dehalococcoidia bacterium]